MAVNFAMDAMLMDGNTGGNPKIRRLDMAHTQKQALQGDWAQALVAGVLVWGALFPALAAVPVPEKARPNIVFVLLDDAGFSDFGAYGSEIQTPNIDQIAATGVRFTNFHTASTCESSRAMLHSGIDHHRAGA